MHHELRIRWRLPRLGRFGGHKAADNGVQQVMDPRAADLWKAWMGPPPAAGPARIAR